MSADLMWTVVEENGAAHPVAVVATPGQWRATATEGPLEGLANESSRSARRAVAALAVRAKWEPAEILAPGVPSRAQLAAYHAVELDAARAEGRDTGLQEGAVRAASVAESHAVDCDLNAADARRDGDDDAEVAWEDMAKLAREIGANILEPTCSVCGEPATCFGSYESGPPAYACDECCGHGGEDGHCEPVAPTDAEGADNDGAAEVTDAPV